MIVRKHGSQLCLIFLIISLFVSCDAFTFTFSSQPSQCQSLTAQWSGGQGPYRLFLIPVGHVTPEVRSIVNMEIPANQTSATLQLKLPENSRFVAVMSDSTGFGAGGTSTIYTVGSGASDCLPTSPSKTDFYMYLANNTPSQCGSLGVTWDKGVSGVHIYGIIPGGQSFDLGAPTSGTGFDWTANVRQGTQMLFLAVGGNNENGGSTDVTTISSGSSGCITPQSPSSTANPPAGGVSTAAGGVSTAVGGASTAAGGVSTAAGGVSTAAQSGPATASGANPTQPGGTMEATGTAGATGTSGASATDSSGGSPMVTNSPTATNGSGGGSNPVSSTKGSGGGTVTGDPNLPVATSNSIKKRRRLNLGAIIGGTLGGITLILLLILFWLLCARRRRANQNDDNERLISQSDHHRTDLLADAAPIMNSHSGYEDDPFHPEPFVPPMSAEEFAQHTGGHGFVGHEDQDDEYHDDHGRSMSSLGHAALTNSSAAAAMYGALARSPSYSTSGHGHRGSTQLSHSQSHSHSHSQNVSHSPAHSTSRHNTSSHTHSRSFSDPFNFFTPVSSVSRTGRGTTPPTAMSSVDPIGVAVSRPPPSSWNNQASGSSNVVPRVRQSAESNALSMERKSGEEELDEPVPEGDVVDLPPTYASLKRSSRRVMNP